MMTSSQHAYEVRPRKDHRGVDLISDALPFVACGMMDRTLSAMRIGYAEQYSRSHGAVIRVFDEAGKVIDTHEHKGEFEEP